MDRPPPGLTSYKHKLAPGADTSDTICRNCGCRRGVHYPDRYEGLRWACPTETEIKAYGYKPVKFRKIVVLCSKIERNNNNGDVG